MELKFLEKNIRSVNLQMTPLFLNNLTSVQNSLKLLDEFGNISGLKLNVEKTKVIWLGSQRCNESKPFGLKRTRKPVRTLGTFIYYDDKENTKKNVEVKIDNMTTKLYLWRARNLSLLGKCLIVKCLGIPHLVYSASMSVIPINSYY